MRISKQFPFESSHLLPKHPGKCSRLHGHSWVLEVAINGRPNPDSSFVMDYAELTELMKPLVDFLDHRHLNFLIVYPSSENLCQFFGRLLHRLVDGIYIHQVEIKLKETMKTEATWNSANPVDLETMMSNSGSHPVQPPPPHEMDQGIELVGGAYLERAELFALRREFIELIRTFNRAVNGLIESNRNRAFREGRANPGAGGGAILMGGK